MIDRARNAEAVEHDMTVEMPGNGEDFQTNLPQQPRDAEELTRCAGDNCPASGIQRQGECPVLAAINVEQDLAADAIGAIQRAIRVVTHDRKVIPAILTRPAV